MTSRGRGTLTEENFTGTLREIRTAQLAAEPSPDGGRDRSTI